MQKPTARPSVTLVAHASAAQAVMMPDQPVSGHAAIPPAVHEQPTTALAGPMHDTDAMHATIPGLTQVRKNMLLEQVFAKTADQLSTCWAKSLKRPVA